jgi:nicotinate-nucleotide adenylyltransferase
MGKSGARIGIYGGSFNPIHSGHIALAEFALSELNLDKVYFVPSNRSYHKTPALLPASLRVRCVKAALKGKKGLAFSTADIRRGGDTYTIDTLKDFRRKFGPEAALYFLAGADNARGISRWKSSDKVLKSCRFAVFSRPGAKRIKTPPGVIWADFPALDVSSSGVRKALAAGRSLRGLVPPSVEMELKKFRKAGSRSK